MWISAKSISWCNHHPSHHYHYHLHLRDHIGYICGMPCVVYVPNIAWCDLHTLPQITFTILQGRNTFSFSDGESDVEEATFTGWQQDVLSGTEQSHLIAVSVLYSLNHSILKNRCCIPAIQATWFLKSCKWMGVR